MIICRDGVVVQEEEEEKKDGLILLPLLFLIPFVMSFTRAGRERERERAWLSSFASPFYNFYTLPFCSSLHISFPFFSGLAYLPCSCLIMMLLMYVHVHYPLISITLVVLYNTSLPLPFYYVNLPSCLHLHPLLFSSVFFQRLTIPNVPRSLCRCNFVGLGKQSASVMLY
ncbi:hypothetical protein V8F06_012321 [Rhypophila decipiens]